jgi:hypothetical protein
VRCFAKRAFNDTTALLLERCRPGIPLKQSIPEPEQDLVITSLMRRLWDHRLPADHPFERLERLTRRMAELLDLDSERVKLWLFARCSQESLRDPAMREPARTLAH